MSGIMSELSVVKGYFGYSWYSCVQSLCYISTPKPVGSLLLGVDPAHSKGICCCSHHCKKTPNCLSLKVHKRSHLSVKAGSDLGKFKS